MKPKLSPFDIAIDAAVVVSAQNGEERAFEEIFNNFSKPVFNLAYRFCNDKQLSEDILQNSFIKVFNSIHTYRCESPFGFWLRKVAINESLMLLRQQKRLPKVMSIDQYQASHSNDEELSQLMAEVQVVDSSHQVVIESTLNKALALLPQQTRIVLWLKEVEGFSHKEIAEIMGQSESFSKSTVSRAFQRLRNCFISTNQPQQESH